ncbi:response regulator transcription factor [Micromonospora sp. C28ISP2-4]|uniref:LuxR C-terminal-related transcriptional regulator n=1 Tax=Micromonospora sp. C28ISP2-4 TaxID=3059523 RepID=UPI002676925F|nr:response regulator transcription factor [Micromonospora sp. C28ISP2-4]MDO3684903.1 response regulator transcription factor [Micromonospora sp. C28ISP2-4]
MRTLLVSLAVLVVVVLALVVFVARRDRTRRPSDEDPAAVRRAGAEATTRITAHPGAPRVLIVTTYDSDADTLPAIEAGATGYLLKDAPPEDLAAAVRTAAAGRTTLAPAVADRLMNRLRTPGTALTRREAEVIALVADGLSNQAIGARLHLTEGMVKSHLARIYAKLGVDSRTAAVATATDLGLIRR